ncbi:MAG: DUF5723 family protein [bacterium]
MIRKCILTGTLLLLLYNYPLKGQEMLGTTLGNYSGINSIQLNPSAMHSSKTYLDIQFLGADVFLENNFLYQTKSDYRFSHFFEAGYEWPTHQESYGTEERIFYRYDNTRFKNVFSNVRINGPGAMLIWNDHAFGITTSVRNVFSAHNIPYELANFIYLGLNYQQQHNINYQDNRPFSGAEMAWMEVGLSYAYRFYARNFDMFTAAVTVKRLFGAAGAYIQSNQLDYVVINDSTMSIKNMNAQYGVALPLNYQTNAVDLDKLFKGGGFAFDVGVTYQRLREYHKPHYFTTFCSQRYEDYIYRIGVALIDVGAVRFKTNARKYSIDDRSAYWDNLTSIKFRSVDQLLDTISYKFYGNDTAALVSDKFMIWLPSALSIQFDYHWKKHWYVNASLICGFNLSRASLSRPAELTITPRYENKWFEASLPISLYDWYLPRIGLALRFYGFTIGTEKLGGFFSMSNFTGLDLYFSIKLFFNKGNCTSSRRSPCGNLEFNPND